MTKDELALMEVLKKHGITVKAAAIMLSNDCDRLATLADKAGDGDSVNKYLGAGSDLYDLYVRLV